MASAVLASQNDSSWVPMGKIPCSHPHLDSNPNPNPKKKQKQFHHPPVNDIIGVGRHQNINVDCPAVTQAVSDDAYSFNQTSTSRNAFNYGTYLTFNVASYTNSELLGLRRRFSSELDQVRDLRDRIDSSQFGFSRNPRSQAKSKKVHGNKPSGGPLASVKDSSRLSNGFDVRNGDLDKSIDIRGFLKECKQILTKLMKHKCGWVFKAPVDSVALGLHDYHLIVKCPMDLGTVKANLAKNLYPTPIEFAADVRLTFNNALLYNPKADPVNGMAEQMLSKFEEMFKPIQDKIDSFSNHHRVRDSREFSVNQERCVGGIEDLQGSSWNNHNQILAPSPLRGKKTKSNASPVQMSHVGKKQDRLQMPMQAHSSASTASNPPPPSSNRLPMLDSNPSPPAAAPSLPVKEPKVGRGGSRTVKQPRPRAKDQNKRDMSMEEKQKLGIGLQSLPQEKMPQLVHIIRKRNEHLAQDGDEIELDIEALDTETLWELDRFVTNWKKLVSKTKRQALMMNSNSVAEVAPSTPVAEMEMGAMDDEDDGSGKKLKEHDEEDVDIDDDMPAASFPPVEIEKDEGAGFGNGVGNDQDDRPNASSGSSSSSSSSSGSSSSSDSDSGSSSGSDSDADDAQS